MTGVTGEQHRHMHALWRAAGVTDRGDRLALTTAAVGREIGTSAELTHDEAARLLDYMRSLDAVGLLAERVEEFLAERVKAGA